MLEQIGLHYQPNVLTIVGLIIAAVFLGSKVFQRFGVPQVVGFIVMGVLLGNSGLNLVSLELSEELSIISDIALGLIGFDIGSHLLLPELRKLGRSILFILLFEAIGTFALVSLGIYLLTHSWHTALIFGALSSATAPAATVDVLAEYDAKGPLTTSLLAVIGLDDVLALVLYSLAAAWAESLINPARELSAVTMVGLPLIEVGGSLLLGFVAGWLLDTILCRMQRRHDAMAVSIGLVLLVAGLADALGFSLILAAMVLGMVTINRCADHSRHIRYTIEQAGPVVYVLFFALVGAHFQISQLPAMGLIGLAYIALRSTGKFSGAWVGGVLGRAQAVVRDNLGLGLLTQGGVAIGLALATASRFGALGDQGRALGSLVINTIAATTIAVEIIGPICVKLAITRAGEVGRARLEHEPWASEGAPE